MRSLITLKVLFIVCFIASPASFVYALPVTGQGTWETTLHPRDFNRDLIVDAYYDSVLDITWRMDANLPVTAGSDDDGLMTWAEATAWVGPLWRLPRNIDTGITGCNFSYNGTDCGYNADPNFSEMASLFYRTLGNIAQFNTSGHDRSSPTYVPPTPDEIDWGLSNTGPFENIQPGTYWTSTELTNITPYVFNFDFNSGEVDTAKTSLPQFYVWPVRDGDPGQPPGGPVSGQGTWETTLHPRDLDGDALTAEAYYDSTLDITWLADTSYVSTTGYEADGTLRWRDALAWVATLNISGITGWRLPSHVDVDNDGCNWQYHSHDCGYNVDTSTGEMASLWYDTLGNLASATPSGIFRGSANYVPADPNEIHWGLTNTGPFINLNINSNAISNFWYAEESVVYSDHTYVFRFNGGETNANKGTVTQYPFLIVHDGDVGEPIVEALDVPLPTWLVFAAGSLLAGIGILVRRRS